MQEAYRSGSRLARKLIERDRPDVAHGLTTTQVVVVRGQFDRAESIFELAGIPCTGVEPQDVVGLDLQPDQVLLIDCPGKLPGRALMKVRDFVHRGGLLVTTDWALRHVIERAFPGFVAYGGRATADDVVRVVFEPVEDGFLDGLLDGNDDPLWWLEGSSYPIEVLDPARVKVLVSSEEMERKYGKAPIVVAFEAGEGKVYHLTSHFYLQRAESRTARHAARGSEYLREKGVCPSVFSSEERAAFESASLTEVQSAYTSSRAMANLVITQTDRLERRRKRS